MPVVPQILSAKATVEGVAVLWMLGAEVRLVCAPTWRKALGSILMAGAQLDPEVEADHWLAAVLACGRQAARDFRVATARS